MSDVAAIYDQYWTEHGFRPPSNDNTFITESIALECRAGRTVADLGCGDARTVGDRAVAGGATYVGADVSRSGVEAAQSRGLDVRQVPDIAATGLDDASFDAVFMIEVLEHLLDPESAVAEARRLLKPGGRFVATVPNAAVWPRRVELAVFGRPNAMGDDLSRSQPWRDPHLRSFTTTSLRDLLIAGGFSSPEVGGTEPVPGRLGDAVCRLRPTLFARRVTARAAKTG